MEAAAGVPAVSGVSLPVPSSQPSRKEWHVVSEHSVRNAGNEGGNIISVVEEGDWQGNMRSGQVIDYGEAVVMPGLIYGKCVYVFTNVAQRSFTSSPAKFEKVVTKAMSQGVESLTASGLAIDLKASRGDTAKLKRALHALYHPGNYYLIHMDYDAPESEQKEMANFVSSEPVFSKVGNVWIVGKPNLVTYRGPTMLATVLHAMSMLLRIAKWDWFINLSASDYPLVTQDGMV
ncbi:hypothetical protein F0562_017270 [Nyssa sinensis]|uniref:Allantoinase composite domain-containing protein n=1 Tax=Nyssa sinensis TaxID=561372 RepID=A0A5J4ZHC9_9ASTE|nr:hypothetical protein F0562_017270 [Nyssa sinensis]